MPTLDDRLNDGNIIAFRRRHGDPAGQKFEAGYIAGAKSVNPDVEVISLYVGNFEDTAKAKELGITAIDQGADIVFAAAGLPGAGVAQACVEQGALFIGVDADQYETLPESQDVIITSAIKRVDQAVFLTTQAVIDETFESGIREFGLAEDGVGLAPYHNFEDVIPQEMKDAVDQAAAGRDRRNRRGSNRSVGLGIARMSYAGGRLVRTKGQSPSLRLSASGLHRGEPMTTPLLELRGHHETLPWRAGRR